MALSEGAQDLLRKMLALEVAEQVRAGGGDDPMSGPWLELFHLSLEDPKPKCPYTFAHTRHWCGNDSCRNS